LDYTPNDENRPLHLAFNGLRRNRAGTDGAKCGSIEEIRVPILNYSPTPKTLTNEKQGIDEKAAIGSFFS